MTAENLWERLKADNLVEGDLPKQEHPASPWYVRVMLGIAGWIGAIFLLLFAGVAFSFIMDDAVSAIGVGAVSCAAAWFLFRQFAGNDFAEQFALAISLVGQVLLIVGLGQFMKFEDPLFYLAIAATQAVLAVAVPNFLHRILATGGTAIALTLAVNQLSLHGISAPLLCAGLAFIWLEPKRWAADGRMWRPVGYGLVLALLIVETFRLFGAEQWFDANSAPGRWLLLYGPIAGRVLNAGILVWVATRLARREGVRPGSPVFAIALGGAVVLAAFSVTAPGLASALLILLLGFAAGNRIVAALGVLSLLGFVTHFYYSLHASLLAKSGLLAVTGLCLLAAHFLLRRCLPSTPALEAGHA
jgi:hypothetical protein